MRVLLGLSGGLDSAFAAVKLKREGHSVVGAVLIMHEYTDLSDAKEAATLADIPLIEIDARAAFDAAVKANFVSEYAKARTPNPCIICNPEVKFKLLYEYAKENGFDKIATGHYSRLYKNEALTSARTSLARAKDKSKDQTYMLYRLPSEILDMLIFPLSEMTKDEVRKQAATFMPKLCQKRESQEICFLPDGDYASYIEARLGRFCEGDFVDENGNFLGKHKGIIRYTTGQRKGLGVSAKSRLFVSEIDAQTSRITLSEKPKMPTIVFINGIIYSGIDKIEEETVIEADVQLRYRADFERARVHLYADGTAKLCFFYPVKFVSRGQSAVLFDNDRLLLGGFIDRFE